MMRKTEGRRRVAWALALGWAFAGGLAEPLGAEVPSAPETVGVAETVEFDAEPVVTAPAATTAATTATAAAAATTAQSCSGSGFCVTVIDAEVRIPFTGIGVSVTCEICECTWVEDGRLHRNTWGSCTQKTLGVRS